MSRPISLEGMRSLFRQETDHVWAMALTISHPSAPGDSISVIQDNAEHTFEGRTYLACEPLQIFLADDSDQSIPQPKIRVDAVDRAVIELARSVSTPPLIDLELFRIDPAGVMTREWGPEQFFLTNFRTDANSMEGYLGYKVDWLNEPACHYRFNETLARAAF